MKSSNIFRIARDRQGLRQKQVAKLAGVSQQAVSDLESGTSKTSRGIVRVMSVLGVSVEDVIGAPSSSLSWQHTPPRKSGWYAWKPKGTAEPNSMLALVKCGKSGAVAQIGSQYFDQSECGLFDWFYIPVIEQEGL